MKCKTRYCKNKTRGNRRLCGSCSSRVSRKNIPIRYAYTALVNNAKRRGKPCYISLEDFTEFCIETDYLAGKGRTKKSYSVDCVINELGYIRGNLQRLSVSDNSKKGTKRLHYNWETREASVETVTIINHTENPF